MSYKATVLTDSFANEQRIVTMEATFPRFILAEFNTHRMLSRNSASSRAIPPEKIIDKLASWSFIPTFNKRVKGMGVGEPLESNNAKIALDHWKLARNNAISSARILNNLDIDKSRVNRLLEPFMWHTVIFTATDLSNFFALRNHPDAQPEFQHIASMMQEAIEQSVPLVLESGEWHLPLLDYGSDFAEAKETGNWQYWAYVSAGRCARSSYDTMHKPESKEDSVARADRLVQSGHMSPFEHQAYPFTDDEIYYMAHIRALISNVPETYISSGQKKAWAKGLEYSGNFHLWHQFRKDLDNEDDFSKVRND